MHVRSGTDHDILLYKAVLIPEGDSSTSTVQLGHNAMHYIGGRKTARRSEKAQTSPESVCAPKVKVLNTLEISFTRLSVG
jgi:hypothetical protein